MKKRKPLAEIIQSLSPREFENAMEQSEREFRQKQKAAWTRLVPQIAFVLLRCNAKRTRAGIYEIAEEAFATYPNDFAIWHGGRKIPDHSLVLLTLNEATRRQWGYAAGNWFRGWRLTKKGLAFARDVDRRKKSRTHGSSAT